MYCILSAICAKKSPNRIRSFLLGLEGVGRPYKLPPLVNGTVGYQLHSYNHITCNKVLQVGEECLLLVLAVKLRR